MLRFKALRIKVSVRFPLLTSQIIVPAKAKKALTPCITTIDEQRTTAVFDPRNHYPVKRKPMANFNDLIGAFLQNAAAPSSQNRMGVVLENLQKAGFGRTGAPGEAVGMAGGLLGGVLDAMQKGLAGAARNPAQAGGLGAILGGLLGGGGDFVKGALGGGALAMLASVAMKALMGAGQTPRGGAGSGWSGGSIPLGLKTPESPAEEQALANTAQLVLKGMINAAKADGQIDQEEGQRITGILQQAGVDQHGQQWVMSEMYRPLDLDIACHRGGYGRGARLPAAACPCPAHGPATGCGAADPSGDGRAAVTGVWMEKAWPLLFMPVASVAVN
jgi:uncharacterized membrane protein YebE (DUF533 family)